MGSLRFILFFSIHLFQSSANPFSIPVRDIDTLHVNKIGQVTPEQWSLMGAIWSASSEDNNPLDADSSVLYKRSGVTVYTDLYANFSNEPLLGDLCTVNKKNLLALMLTDCLSENYERVHEEV